MKEPHCGNGILDIHMSCPDNEEDVGRLDELDKPDKLDELEGLWILEGTGRGGPTEVCLPHSGFGFWKEPRGGQLSCACLPRQSINQ